MWCVLPWLNQPADVPARKITIVNLAPDAQGNWFQQLLARLTNRGEAAHQTSPSRYGSVGAAPTAAEAEAAKSKARQAMQDFRKEHVDAQGGGDHSRS